MTKHPELSDEELVLSIRLGDPTAYSTLAQRFFAMRQYSGRVAAPQWIDLLDPWKFNEVFFLSFLKAVDTYRFRKARLLTYYHRILGREIAHEGAKILREREMFRSLDENVGVSEDGNYTLHDVVSSTETTDDPAAFFRYAESLERLNRLPTKVGKATIHVIRLRLQGYRMREIAELLHITMGKVRYCISCYVKWAVKTFANIYGLDLEGQEEKRKLLEQHLKTAAKE